MADFNLHLDTDEILRMFGPVETIGGAAITSDVTGSVIRLFDSAKDTKIKVRQTTLAAIADTPDTTITVKDDRGFRDLDTVDVDLDNDDVHRTTVAGTPSGNVVTLLVPIPSKAKIGADVRVVIQASGATLLYVDKGKIYTIGDTLQIHHVADDTYHAASVVQTADNEVQIDPATIQALSAGDQIRRKLGADIAMETSFGTPESPKPTPKSEAWGFLGKKLETHADLRVALEGFADYILRGGTGKNLHLTRTFTVVGKE